MDDLQLLFCIISLFAGVASITLAVFINIDHTKKVLKYFIGFDISLFTIQAMITLNLYIVRTNNMGTFLSVMSNGMDVLGTSFSSLFGLLFIHALLGKRISKIKQILIVVITAFQLTAITICYANSKLVTLKHLGQASLIAVIAYEVFTVLINYREIPNKELKRTSRIFAIITLSFLPFLAFEYIRTEMNVLKDLQVLKMLALPAYFLIINISILHWSYAYFNTPAYISENKLTQYFIEKYGITDKETEVIELILGGLTYKQIADRLFISPKTVDNHVQNIYKKLQVTSKMQLSNLIRSKEK
ncbi:MAG: helix-turn-helix transcriptional regulator [Clostridiales bacterium]|nr:helix-turn-helix transcriptional regulator [Clostridiales bacterium]MCI1961066.1 helix-turn-helix transcriptional regulator [Clostridiales bacterium]MCI2021507.1 helix-turn-helix transcriptional regulator [Clostridiales bacterium]MCI2026293.1 helix-turn-helix transcriptional regulator [Clostridiales bacterium]